MWDATPSGLGTCWNDGKVSIYASLTTGYQWDVVLYDPYGNVHFSYNSVLNNTAVLFQYLFEGVGWSYTITDNNFCQKSGSFDVLCKPGGDPCDPCPAWKKRGNCIELKIEDATDPDCTNGYAQINFGGFTLPPSVTGWKVRWYTVDASGTETFIQEDDCGGWCGATDQVTWYGIQPLTYTYKYVIVTDQIGPNGNCEYEEYFDIDCEGNPPGPCGSNHFGSYSVMVDVSHFVDPCVDTGYSGITFTDMGQILVGVGSVGGTVGGLYTVEVWDSWVYTQNHPINTGGTYVDGASGVSGGLGITFSSIIPDPSNPNITGATYYQFTVVIADAIDPRCNITVPVTIECIGGAGCNNPCGGATGMAGSGTFLYTNYVSMIDCSCDFEGDDQSCCWGCQEPSALNYPNTPSWNTNLDCVGNAIPNAIGPFGDTSCCVTTAIYGCTDALAVNSDCANTASGGTCGTCQGAFTCFDGVTTDDGSCCYPGCTDPNATNYQPMYCDDDGSCIYTESWDCASPGNCQDYGFGIGAYPTESACLDGCPPPPPSWTCVSPGNCQDLGFGTGPYPTQGACNTACPPTPPDPCIGTTSIPDSDFEEGLITLGYDSGPLDQSVISANICGVTSLTITSGNNIPHAYDLSDTTGIEDFVALELLNFSSQNISTIDLSNNIALKELYLHNNMIATIDLSANINLEKINLNTQGGDTYWNPGYLTDIYLGDTLPLSQIVMFVIYQGNSAHNPPHGQPLTIHVGTAIRVQEAQDLYVYGGNQGGAGWIPYHTGVTFVI